jgi:hypothetical protein
MTFKNRKQTLALQIENTIVGNGKMIRFLPCIDIFWSENICIGISWLFLSIDIWIGNVEEI